jgi:outer membrane protein TolC
MKRRVTFVKVILACSFIVVGLMFTSSNTYATELSQLVEEAVANNSDLATARARWEQSTYKSPQVSSLKDPVLTLALSNYPSDTLSGSQTPMTGNELKLAQMFPFPGKLENRAALADEQARWFEAAYYDKHYLIARKVKDAWFRLYFKKQAIMVTERNLALVDDIIRLTEVRYETGTGLQQDVLKAQVQRSRLMEKEMTLRQQSIAVQAELNNLLNSPATRSFDTPESLDLPKVNYSLDEFLAAGTQKRPMNNAYQALVKRFRYQKKLAELDDYPDVTLWGSWRFRDDGLPDGGTDFVSAGVSFNLPVYKEKRRAATAEAVAAIRVTENRAQGFRSGVTESIKKAYARMEETFQQSELYREGIIPQTSQSLQAAMGAYQVGKVAFISLLDALMTTFKVEMEYYRFSSEYMRSLAWLEAESTLSLIGPPLHENNQELSEFIK